MVGSCIPQVAPATGHCGSPAVLHLPPRRSRRGENEHPLVDDELTTMTQEQANNYQRWETSTSTSRTYAQNNCSPHKNVLWRTQQKMARSSYRLGIILQTDDWSDRRVLAEVRRSNDIEQATDTLRRRQYKLLWYTHAKIVLNNFSAGCCQAAVSKYGLHERQQDSEGQRPVCFRKTGNRWWHSSAGQMHYLPPVGGTGTRTQSRRGNTAVEKASDIVLQAGLQMVSEAWNNSYCHLDGCFLSRCGQHEVADQLGHAGMQWLAVATRTGLAQWMLYLVLRSDLPCQPTTAFELGMENSVRNVCSERVSMKQWQQTQYRLCWKTSNLSKDPHSSWHAGNSAKPSSNRISIMRLPKNLEISSGPWFKTIFLPHGPRRPHRSQMQIEMKGVEVTNQQRDPGEVSDTSAAFPPVGGPLTADTLHQIQECRGHLQAQKHLQKAFCLACGGKVATGRACAVMNVSLRARALNPTYRLMPRWCPRMLQPGTGTRHMWNGLCETMNTLQIAWEKSSEKLSGKCKTELGWNFSCGHGDMWTVASRFAYRTISHTPSGFRCGSSYMHWKQQKQNKNVRLKTHTWTQMQTSTTAQRPTTQPQQAGILTSKHQHVTSAQVQDEPKESDGRGRKNELALTSDTREVDWGKRARRAKPKQPSKQIKRAKHRWRFWYSWQSGTELRHLLFNHMMYLAGSYSAWQAGRYMYAATTPGMCGVALSLAVTLLAIAISIVSKWRHGTLPSTGPHGRHEWPQSTTQLTACRLGPKSQKSFRSCKICTSTSRTCKTLLYALLLNGLALTRGTLEVRVAASTSEAVGVNSVHERAGHSVQTSTTTPARYTWTAKRAFRRARARAREGPTWYKGRWHTAQTLSSIMNVEDARTKRGTNSGGNGGGRPHRRDQRIRILTLNVGGMSSATWNEVQAWLNLVVPDKYDVVAVQETHWKQSSDFSSGPWHIVSSGCTEGDKCAGVLVMVHRRLGNPQNILHREILKGRVQHVRILHGPTAVDIVNIYQHVWRSQLDHEQNTTCRSKVWNAFRRTTEQLPKRNTTIWCGDFNISATTFLPHVGTSVLPVEHKYQHDEAEFQSILQQQGLCVLNTWSNPQKATCTMQGQASQIDFVMTRMQQEDRMARSSSSLHNAEVGAWKTNRHYPVQSTVPLHAPWKMKHQVGQHSKLNKRLLQDEITRLTPRAQQLQTNIAQQIRQLSGTLEPGDMTIQLDQILLTEAIKLYPAEEKKDDRVCNNAGFKTALQQMWNEYRQLRRPRVTTLANIWSTWRRYTRFQQLSKTLKSKAKQAKQDNVHVVMLELEKAANAGDQYRVYQSAKKLAPWKPSTKVVIRGTDGQMLNHEEQLRALQDHAQQKFCKQQDYHPGPSLRYGIVIDEQELQQAPATLPIRKAAPPGVAPSALWKLCSTDIARKIKPVLDVLWRPKGAGRVPPIWRDTDLAWLPKPNKDSSRPENLRPIGLIHPLSKAITTVLRMEIRPLLEAALQRLPQFAYTGGRSTYDALLRVHGHGLKVRQLLERHCKSVYALKAGQQQCHCAGGISFSLDLSGAFDSVPRRLLAQSLFRLGAAQDVIHVLMAFHHQAQYWSTVAGHRSAVTTTQGIKQGCKIAPFLFVSFTVMVMEILAQRISPKWVQEGLTIFADDHWAAWTVEDRSTLRGALREIQTVIDVLEENGLQLNAKKSAILFDLKGKDVMKELGVYMQQNEEGKRMIFQSQQGSLAIPVRKSHEYLGTIFAYRESSQLNLQHRLLKSRGQYAMLRKVVHARRIISKQHRYRIWSAGVLTSATYGIYAVGLTTSGKTQLKAMVSRQLRAIAAMPAHLTHVTNLEVRAQFGFPDILEQIHTQACKHHAKLAELQAHQPNNICVQPVAMQQLREVIQDLAPREQHGVLQEIRSDAADTVTCPECGLQFASLKSMRQHRASKHKIKVANTQAFHPEVHSLGGLPQCSGCRHKFRTWCALKKHIEQGSCRTPHFAEPSVESNRQQSACEAFGSKVDTPSESGALRHLPGVQQLIQESGWTAMVQSQHAENMKQHCCLCGRWIVDAAALKRHIKGAHKALWCKHQPQLQSACKQLQHTLKRDQPCQYCGRVAYNRHYFQCCVIFQAALLGLIQTEQHVDCQRTDQHVRTLDAQLGGGCTATSLSGEANLLTDRRPEHKAQAGEEGRSSWAQEAGGDGRNHHFDGTNRHPARRSVGAESDGQGLHPVHGTNWPRGRVVESLPGRSGMEPEERRTRSGEQTPATKNDAADADGHGTGGKTGKAAGLQGRQDKVSTTRLAERGRSDAVPNMGSRAKEADGIHRPGATDYRSGSQNLARHHPSHQPGPRVEVSCSTPLERDVRSREQSSLQSGDQLAGSCSTPAIWPCHAPRRKLVLADYWRTGQKGHAAKVGSSSSATTSGVRGVRRPESELNATQQQLLKQRLINTSNTCYVNACIMAILWQVADTAWPSLPEAWKKNIERFQWYPVDLLRFTMMGWRQAHRQHDVGEYLGFLLPRLNWISNMVTWSCRLQAEDGGLIHNAKSQAQVLALDPAEGLHHTSLQVLLGNWHQQAQLHALDSEVDNLFLQIPRFQVLEGGHVLKHSLQLKITPNVPLQVPVFTHADSINVRWVHYEITSMIAHEGDSPSHGHYRTILMHPNRTGEHWYTDDGEEAEYQASINDHTASNCYILVCRRC